MAFGALASDIRTFLVALLLLPINAISPSSDAQPRQEYLQARMEEAAECMLVLTGPATPPLTATATPLRKSCRVQGTIASGPTILAGHEAQSIWAHRAITQVGLRNDGRCVLVQFVASS